MLSFPRVQTRWLRKNLYSVLAFNTPQHVCYINNLTYILFKSIEQNIGLKVIIIYVVSLPFKFRTKTSTQHAPFCTPNMVILPIYGIAMPRGGGGGGGAGMNASYYEQQLPTILSLFAIR